jgi:hypothetical protein
MKNKEQQTFVPLYNSRRISKVNNCAICIFFSSYFFKNRAQKIYFF